MIFHQLSWGCPVWPQGVVQYGLVRPACRPPSQHAVEVALGGRLLVRWLARWLMGVLHAGDGGVQSGSAPQEAPGLPWDNHTMPLTTPHAASSNKHESMGTCVLLPVRWPACWQEVPPIVRPCGQHACAWLQHSSCLCIEAGPVKPVQCLAWGWGEVGRGGKADRGGYACEHGTHDEQGMREGVM